ncbi:hypothetical protein G6F31_018707 [Rhizopus arrhizus]|nr:hypothetical protein G6F31_018707 [Rhizopus arrhizus]
MAAIKATLTSRARLGDSRHNARQASRTGRAENSAFQQVGDDLHARHAAEVVRDRRGVRVAQAGGPGAHQHVLASQRFGRHVAAQHRQVGDGAYVAPGAGIGDQDAALGPGPLQQLLRFIGLASDREHGQRKMEPAFAREFGGWRGLAHDAVGVHARVDAAA